MPSKRIILAAYLGVAQAVFHNARQTTSDLEPMTYHSLPLTAIMPSGWLHDQLNVQTQGLAGHEHDFYSYVSDSDWIGGTSYYSNLEEAGSYWFNGMVPNAYLMNDTTRIAQVQQFLSYVLEHQQSDGWIGPETGSKPRYMWGRYPFFFGAIQMTEADPSQKNTIVAALNKFVPLANSMLKEGLGIEPWMQTRWSDFIMTLQWMYDNNLSPNNTMLLETMQLLRTTGDDWIGVFQKENFPTIAVDNLTAPFGVLTWHGVNMAEGLKAPAAAWRFSHNQSDLDAAVQGWDLLFEYHGRPSGIYSADEYLAGLEAVRGTELCLVVETMFSGSYLYQVTGNPKFVDRVERIAYNALPATLTGNMWSRQYLQQQNQIAAQSMSPNPFKNDGPYSNVFGLEPNYPCCTVNHPQGWPKFISNAFVTSADGSSLVHVYLGPFSTKVTLSGNNQVSVSVNTLYPFSDTLTTTIQATKPFTYYVRIPSWSIGKATISINGAAAVAATPDSTTQLFKINAAEGATKFVLNVPADITLESRPHGAVAVQRGPLHYAFDIARNQTTLATNAQQPLAVDLQFEATVPWQYAIDPASLKFQNNPPSSGVLPSPVFDAGLPPLSITATACRITWATAGSTFAAAPPQSPVACTGANETIVLRPFGSTKLRIGEIPIMK
ncbi:hypothetical protein M422DRAFT_273413 [Sphaerobolus stellatus SS14]|uniref:Non-reducing end beta-L-arabinofuranosidase-like GH127 middle domain-containing protein n=1 Tax=Sphaerobolus stellatus (strain SS14) TaxID=990650 RepID=A0A0C9UK14_SPHS4|nr:hypothetical protein M422DRAFT_273413 [Sphaerobolus stellatus SS14]